MTRRTRRDKRALFSPHQNSSRAEVYTRSRGRPLIKSSAQHAGEIYAILGCCQGRERSVRTKAEPDSGQDANGQGVQSNVGKLTSRDVALRNKTVHQGNSFFRGHGTWVLRSPGCALHATQQRFQNVGTGQA